MTDITMRAGMALAERQDLRECLLEREYERARAQVALMYQTSQCRSAQTPAQHGTCLGEAAGSGCLCTCHDPASDPSGETDAEG